MTLALKKCQWAKTRIKYLGLIVDKNGTRPNAKRVAGIERIPPPANKKALQFFLGTMNYYRAYIPAITMNSQPLNELLKDGVKFVWTSRQQSAFENLALIEATLLAPPNFNQPFHIFTYASLSSSTPTIMLDQYVSRVVPKKLHHIRTQANRHCIYARQCCECLFRVKRTLSIPPKPMVPFSRKF